MNYENIPQIIKDIGQCCVWRYELREGKQTKVPYNPITGRKCQVDHPDTFVNFETAVNAANNYDGIGIRVNGSIIGVDIDHCVANGQILPWALEIIQHFNSTYIEFSPSGTGIRIIALFPDGYVYDKNTYYIKNGKVEVYVENATNRFVIITGNVYQQAEAAEQSEAQQWLIETYMKRSQPLNMDNSQFKRYSYLSDESVMEIARFSSHNSYTLPVPYLCIAVK